MYWEIDTFQCPYLFMGPRLGTGGAKGVVVFEEVEGVVLDFGAGGDIVFDVEGGGGAILDVEGGGGVVLDTEEDSRIDCGEVEVKDVVLYVCGDENDVFLETIAVVLLANVLDVLSGSPGSLSPSSSSKDSGARVHAGPYEVSVFVRVTVVVVSKPGTAPPHMVTVASIIGRHREEIIVDEVPRRLDGSADTLNPSVHQTKRSVMIVLFVSSQASGSGRFGGFVGAGPGFGPHPPGTVQPGRLQSSGGQGSQPPPGQYPS